MSDQAGPADPRARAFCSAEHPEVFHAVAYLNDIWKEDPFDVESIHGEARSVFERLVSRAADPARGGSGRILLLLGEAGSGKTHLMRAFRNWTHSRGRGYYGYLQMTSATNDYARYVLNNLIDSLDQPYYEPSGETSGLMRLSTAVAESPRILSLDRLDQIRNEDLDQECLAKLVDALADQIVMDDRFNSVDLDLVRALLFLQSNNPRIKSRVLKYLRCEDLSEADRNLLGGIIPRTYGDAPQRVIQRLGGLMAAIESVPLILCVDQLEDIYNLDDSAVRFRRAMAALCDLVSRVPTAVIVISCLENFYEALSQQLARSIVDRIENDPAPIQLKGLREEEEIVQIVAQRLRFLYEALDAPFEEDDPTYPFSRDYLRQLVGLRTRDVLGRCNRYHESCTAAGELVPLDGGQTIGPPPPVPPITIEQAWNDFRSSFQGETPVEDEDLAELLAGAIRACSDELEGGQWFEAETDGWMVPLEHHAVDNSVHRLLVGICNRSARGGALAKQVEKVEERTQGQSPPIAPVLVRSTDFPSNPRTQIAKLIGELIAQGGRRVVVEDSDWRAMRAMLQFRDNHQGSITFSTWLKAARPLSSLRSLRTILDLDRPRQPRQAEEDAPAPAATTRPATAPPEPTGEEQSTPIVVGQSDDRAKAPVTLDLGELTRHSAFLGGTGSGKTTVALSVIEQLLLQKIPAVLVDRKGDLCGYAREEAWTRPLDDEAQEERRRQLREQIEVAVYTPGNPNGRPLSIAIVPGGLGRLGSFERKQTARYAASALAGMMNYSTKGNDQSRQALVASAIDLLAQLEPDGMIGLEALISYIAEKDPALLNEVGRLDIKHFERLVQDLETLRLNRGEFLSASGEPLEAEALLGLGRHAAPGKTRLSIISTKFLGAIPDVQFWVSQLLVEMGRWANRSRGSDLQAVLMFDEADLYLPATRQPATKEPMENLLKRARSAGLGLFLATQSPGDFDYKCRDNIRNWFVGRIKEPTALAKMKPMLSDCRVDVSAKLPTQETGQFHLLRDGSVVGLRASRSLIAAEQLPEDEILMLARQTGS